MLRVKPWKHKQEGTLFWQEELLIKSFWKSPRCWKTEVWPLLCVVTVYQGSMAGLSTLELPISMETGGFCSALLARVLDCSNLSLNGLQKQLRVSNFPTQLPSTPSSCLHCHYLKPLRPAAHPTRANTSLCSARPWLQIPTGDPQQKQLFTSVFTAGLTMKEPWAQHRTVSRCRHKCRANSCILLMDARVPQPSPHGAEG